MGDSHYKSNIVAYSGSETISGFNSMEASSLHIGGSSNYLEVEADGTLEFHGDATVWDDVRVSLHTARLPASNYPEWKIIVEETGRSFFVDQQGGIS